MTTVFWSMSYDLQRLMWNRWAKFHPQTWSKADKDNYDIALADLEEQHPRIFENLRAFAVNGPTRPTWICPTCGHEGDLIEDTLSEFRKRWSSDSYGEIRVEVSCYNSHRFDLTEGG